MAGSGVVTSSTTVSDLAINCTIDRNVTPNESFGEGEEVLLILLVLTRQSPLSSARLQPQLHILLTAKIHKKGVEGAVVVVTSHYWQTKLFERYCNQNQTQTVHHKKSYL
ncbi:hypothetical protein DAI22_09g059100 [Oryza sativa Japonica Group]|nr:hypothetical protein DAI22_09g059100 [Oryza sativa Japonica Group]KAF2915701.1 hypothetical protein DAI22_09g059100 [Oryza sativa Japonica Group]